METKVGFPIRYETMTYGDVADLTKRAMGHPTMVNIPINERTKILEMAKMLSSQMGAETVVSDSSKRYGGYASAAFQMVDYLTRVMITRKMQ